MERVGTNFVCVCVCVFDFTTVQGDTGLVLRSPGKTWQEAEQYCIDEYGGHLATIHSTEDARALWSMCKSNNNDYCWIGLRDYDGINQWVKHNLKSSNGLNKIYFFHIIFTILLVLCLYMTY